MHDLKKLFTIACFPVQGWSNFGLITKVNFCCLTCPLPVQFQPTLVIHNYCHSQISFPATRSTPLSVNRYGTGPKGMIRNRIDYTKSEPWCWLSQRYIQATNIYEMLMVVAFILYWMSMFRDHPKPKTIICFVESPSFVWENICHTEHQNYAQNLIIILNL